MLTKERYILHLLVAFLTADRFIHLRTSLVHAWAPSSAPSCTNFRLRDTHVCWKSSAPLTYTSIRSQSPKQQQQDDQLIQSQRFEALLRDLQIEGVPLLGCDAKAVHTMSAAVWTTLSELSESDESQKACLVLEDIPISALQALVHDFEILSTQTRLMDHIFEFHRIRMRLLSVGTQVVGPALILETYARTPQDKQRRDAQLQAVQNFYGSNLHESKVQASLQNFVQRIVVSSEACPYTKSVSWAATGLEAKGVSPGPVAYRYSPSTDICTILGLFWTCVCELLSTQESNMSTVLLSLPGIGAGCTQEAHDRFAAVVEVISRNLCLFRGDGVFGLVHFHPAYDRDRIHPLQKPAYGHLPPMSWLRAMLRMHGKTNSDAAKAAELFTEEQLYLSNYQRRAPCTMINILRMNQLNAAGTGGKSIVDLDINGDGTVFEKASGIVTYSRNAMRLAEIGKDRLDQGLHEDLSLLRN